MQTATIYTLNAKVVSVESYDSTVRMYSINEPSRTFCIENEEPVRIPVSEIIDLPLHHVSSFSRIEPPKDLTISGNTRYTQDHLFAVEPALKEILSAPFRQEWIEKSRDLEINNLTLSRRNHELEEKLKDALSANDSLNNEYCSAAKEIFDLQRKVYKFCQHNLFRRLWIAFRNKLEP